MNYEKNQRRQSVKRKPAHRTRAARRFSKTLAYLSIYDTWASRTIDVCKEMARAINRVRIASDQIRDTIAFNRRKRVQQWLLGEKRERGN